MGNRFAELAFTPTVKELQTQHGSRRSYARMEGGPTVHDRLGPDEAAFIRERDSLYMASVGETGWPYIQHRGGPRGFVRVVDPETLAFSDFTGNRQYISVGNVTKDDRVALFFMDYPNQTRLKLLGRVKLIPPDATAIMEQLAVPGYAARPERGMFIHVEGFDWNCPQHITPRFTQAQVEQAVAPLHQRIARLEEQLQRLKSGKA
jgi:predicted pyridoxine 5'-phosphate oxidase superfamily flavin-nucleotide-binding protein